MGLQPSAHSRPHAHHGALDHPHVLEAIFTTSVLDVAEHSSPFEDRGMQSFRVYRIILLLSHVSHRWRFVIHGMPVLWSNIDMAHFAFASHCLQLSGPHTAVHLYNSTHQGPFWDGGASSSAWAALFKSHLHRISSIVLYESAMLPREAIRAIFSSFESHGNNGELFALENVKLHYDSWSLEERWTKPVVARLHLPSLTTITLVHVPLHLSHPRGLTYTSLKTMSIQLLPENVISIVLPLLKQLPALSRLTLNVNDSSVQGPSRRDTTFVQAVQRFKRSTALSLPVLTELSLTVIQRPSLATVLYNLLWSAAPVLTNMTIGNGDVNEARDFIDSQATHHIGLRTLSGCKCDLSLDFDGAGSRTTCMTLLATDSDCRCPSLQVTTTQQLNVDCMFFFLSALNRVPNATHRITRLHIPLSAFQPGSIHASMSFHYLDSLETLSLFDMDGTSTLEISTLIECFDNLIRSKGRCPAYFKIMFKEYQPMGGCGTQEQIYSLAGLRELEMKTLLAPLEVVGVPPDIAESPDYVADLMHLQRFLA